jgi:hypothetical protein
MPFYKDRVYPHLVTLLGNPKPIREVRQRILPLAEGRILEIGVGPGVNFVHYDSAKVSKVYALGPNPGMIRMAEEFLESSSALTDCFTSSNLLLIRSVISDKCGRRHAQRGILAQSRLASSCSAKRVTAASILISNPAAIDTSVKLTVIREGAEEAASAPILISSLFRDKQGPSKQKGQRHAVYVGTLCRDSESTGHHAPAHGLQPSRGQ